MSSAKNDSPSINLAISFVCWSQGLTDGQGPCCGQLNVSVPIIKSIRQATNTRAESPN